MGRFLDPADPAWAGVVAAARHDVYHLPGYSALCATGGSQALAFHTVVGDTAFLIPLLQHPLPHDTGFACDLISPYGYPGPIGTTATTEPEWPTALEELREGARALGARAVLLRLHPLLNAELPEPRDTSCSAIYTHGPTVFVDLTRPLEEIERGYRRRYRQYIRHLLRLGFRSEVNAWESYDEFQRLYLRTVAARGARPELLFTPAYFEQLRACLGPHLSLHALRAPDGSLAGAYLFTACCGIAQSHLAGVAAAYERDSPSKLLLHHVCAWAKAEGLAVLHLGGGVGSRRDGIFDFKHGFSSTCAQFRTLRMVPDPKAYAAAYGLSPSEVRRHLTAEFFPSAAAPVPVAQEA